MSRVLPSIVSSSTLGEFLKLLAINAKDRVILGVTLHNAEAVIVISPTFTPYHSCIEEEFKGHLKRFFFLYENERWYQIQLHAASVAILDTEPQGFMFYCCCWLVKNLWIIFWSHKCQCHAMIASCIHRSPTVMSTSNLSLAFVSAPIFWYFFGIHVVLG